MHLHALSYTLQHSLALLVLPSILPNPPSISTCNRKREAEKIEDTMMGAIIRSATRHTGERPLSLIALVNNTNSYTYSPTFTYISSPMTTAANSNTARSAMPLLSEATADLYDKFLDDARVPVEISWQSYGALQHFSGPVTTIKCFEDNSRIKECAQTAVTDGRIMVVDAGGSRRCAVLGDWIAAQARDNGWRGIIVYGCVRDVAILKTLDNFGCLALGSTPRKSTRRGEGQVGLAIHLGNVHVNPGDYVVADDDGVIFLTPEQVAHKQA